MKKICALLAALAMTAAVFTGCGDSDSSSKKDSSKDDDTTASTAASDESESKEVTGEIKTWGVFTVLVPEGWTMKGGDVFDENDPDIVSVKKSDLSYFDFKNETEDVQKNKYEYNKNTYTADQKDLPASTIAGIEWNGFEYVNGFELYGQSNGRFLRVSASGFKFDSEEAKAILGSLKVTAAENTPDDSNADDSSASAGEMGPLSAAFAEKMKSGSFEASVKIKQGMLGEITADMKVNGNDKYMHSTLMGIETEVYEVDGKSVTILPETKMYKDGGDLEVSVDSFGIPEGVTYSGTSEEDGLTVETYTQELIDGTKAEVKLWFDADGNLKKEQTKAAEDMTVEIEVISLKFDNVTIEMPDLSGYTKMDDDISDGEQGLKVTLAALGITEDMVTKAGYTFKSLVESGEDMPSIIKQIAKDNNIDSPLLDALDAFGD